MAGELKALRKSGMANRDIISAIQTRYPKFDKTMLSKADTDKYGVQLRREVVDALIADLDPELKATIKHQRGGYHNLTCRITCRLPDDVYAVLQQLIKANGYSTTQAWLSHLVDQYIKENKSKIEGSQTT